MKHTTLDTLQISKTAVIKYINKECKCRLRLMDLGFTADSEITSVWQGKKKNITAYMIKGCLIALRDTEARCINIQKK